MSSNDKADLEAEITKRLPRQLDLGPQVKIDLDREELELKIVFSTFGLFAGNKTEIRMTHDRCCQVNGVTLIEDVQSCDLHLCKGIPRADPIPVHAVVLKNAQQIAVPFFSHNFRTADDVRAAFCHLLFLDNLRSGLHK